MFNEKSLDTIVPIFNELCLGFSAVCLSRDVLS
jgi:hypothetical protein